MPTRDMSLDWKFKWIFWAQFFLFLGVLSSPTIVSLYHIIIIIPALVLLVKAPKIKISMSSWMLLALCIWGLICTIYNFDTVVKPRKAFGELKYYLFGVLLIYPLSYFFERAKEYHYRKLLNTFWIVLIIAFFVGISRAWFQFDPVKMEFAKFHVRSGGFLNYMRYGYASAFIFLLGLATHLNRDKLAKVLNKKLFYMAITLSLFAVFTSKTRGALLALMVGVPFLFLKYKPMIAKTLIGLGMIFVTIVIYFSFFYSGKPPSRFLRIKDGSNNTRMSQFQTAVKAIELNPVLGLGADQFSYNVKRLKEEHDIPVKHYSGHAHNIFLEHGANYGVPGLILIFLFLVFWFFEMVKGSFIFAWPIASYIAAFTVSGQVELLFDNANSHILFYIYSMSQVFKLNRKNKELERNITFCA